VFVLGAAVKPGAHGPYPNLKDLDAGRDPKHAIDFRQVYATLLDEWLDFGKHYLALPQPLPALSAVRLRAKKAC
jgi:uncharacterized protein (DUF1501 family)